MAIFHTFHMPQGYLPGLENIHQVLGNGADMAVGGAVHHQKIMGNARQFGKIKNGGILGLFVQGRIPG